MTSTRALESGTNGPAGTRDDRMHRGRNVVLAFLMQGWGQVRPLLDLGKYYVRADTLLPNRSSTRSS